MKLWFVTPCSREFAGPLAKVLESTIKRFPRKGTTVTCGWIPEGKQPFSTPTLHQFALETNKVAMANSIIVAEKQGYDAGIVGCTIDPGLYAARSVVDMPVTACTESAVLLAHTLGFKFSIIALEDSQASSIHGVLMHYGLTERLASIRGLGVTSEEGISLYSKPKKLINLLTQKARIFIKDDGAEVIIPGCTILSTILSANNCCEIDGVPVVDPIAASIQMAEILVDLRKSCNYRVSRTGLYGREKSAPLSLPLRYGTPS